MMAMLVRALCLLSLSLPSLQNEHQFRDASVTSEVGVAAKGRDTIVAHSGQQQGAKDEHRRQLLQVGLGALGEEEPPHEITVTTLEDGSYDVVLRWVRDRTLTGW